mmetsp:Transcript_16990/g.26316  ORF Transcript_16990/g.26316 Transcript_16990/m.26316 type:complete len:238 (+) Transcript_16990:442-1155(+)
MLPFLLTGLANCKGDHEAPAPECHATVYPGVTHDCGGYLEQGVGLRMLGELGVDVNEVPVLLHRHLSRLWGRHFLTQKSEHSPKALIIANQNLEVLPAHLSFVVCLLANIFESILDHPRFRSPEAKGISHDSLGPTPRPGVKVWRLKAQYFVAYPQVQWQDRNERIWIILVDTAEVYPEVDLLDPMPFKHILLTLGVVSIPHPLSPVAQGVDLGTDLIINIRLPQVHSLCQRLQPAV